jgi:hypothetical protein
MYLNICRVTYLASTSAGKKDKHAGMVHMDNLQGAIRMQRLSNPVPKACTPHAFINFPIAKCSRSFAFW